MHDIEVEGQFQYSDGTEADYFTWRPGQPNNYMNEEDCVTVLFDGTMIDISCGVESWVFCKCIVDERKK